MRIRIKKVPPQNGLKVANDQYKTLSSDGVNLLGKSHKKGGTYVSSNGEVVEAEAGEPIYTDSLGNNVVFGNVENPATKTKFKNEAKDLLKKKGKAEKKEYGANLAIEEADPYSKLGSLEFNSAVVNLDAATVEKRDLKANLDTLANIQQAILSTAEQINTDPKKLSKKLQKSGGTVKVKIKGAPTMQASNGRIISPVQNFMNSFLGVPVPSNVTVPINQGQSTAIQPTFTPTPNSLAARNNNPGNLRFIGQKGATRGDKGFAKFESYEAGMQALINDLRSKQTGRTRTGLKPTSTLQELINVYAPKEDSNDPQTYAKYIAGQLGVGLNTPISQLDTTALASAIARFEDGAYATSQGNTTSTVYNAPVSTTAPIEEERKTPPQRVDLQPIDTGIQVQPLPVEAPTANNVQPIPQERISAEARAQPKPNPKQEVAPLERTRLSPMNFLGEMAALFDQPDFVQGQQYNPNLMQPYRVSFQDRINQNTANFNALAKNFADNPEALATLAGQKYQQDQQILAEEFRVNQGIQNQVANQNVGILNQAQLQNIQLSDQQYARQAQAAAVTDQNRINALNSISNKYAQNELYNQSRELLQQRRNVQSSLTPNYNFNQGNLEFNTLGGYEWYAPPQQVIPLTPQQASQQSQLEAAKKAAQAAFGHKFKKK